MTLTVPMHLGVVCNFKANNYDLPMYKITLASVIPEARRKIQKVKIGVIWGLLEVTHCHLISTVTI